MFSGAPAALGDRSADHRLEPVLRHGETRAVGGDALVQGAVAGYQPLHLSQSGVEDGYRLQLGPHAIEAFGLLPVSRPGSQHDAGLHRDGAELAEEEGASGPVGAGKRGGIHVREAPGKIGGVGSELFDAAGVGLGLRHPRLRAEPGVEVVLVVLGDAEDQLHIGLGGLVQGGRRRETCREDQGRYGRQGGERPPHRAAGRDSCRSSRIHQDSGRGSFFGHSSDSVMPS